MKERNGQIDIFKGILIVLVVIGHEIVSTRFVYWFHMPLFFVLSGYLLKKTDNIMQWFCGKVMRFLIPYYSFYILISLVGLNDRLSIPQFLKLVWGGRQNTGVVGVWWFPTCLLLTLLISQMILRINSSRVQIVIAIILYMVGIAVWKYWLPTEIDLYASYQKLPWNIDVSITMVLFTIVAYNARGIIDKFINQNRINRLLLVSGAIIVVLACGLLGITTETFNVDIKYSQYGNAYLLPLFTFLWGIILYHISEEFAKVNWLKTCLSNIGFNSMTIMYMHVPILFCLRIWIHGDSVAVQIIRATVAFLVSWVAGLVLSKFNVTRAFFVTGDIRKLKWR